MQPDDRSHISVDVTRMRRKAVRNRIFKCAKDLRHYVREIYPAICRYESTDIKSWSPEARAHFYGCAREFKRLLEERRRCWAYYDELTDELKSRGGC